MTKYHKIQTIFKRDMEHPQKKLIIGDWSTPEFEYLQEVEWEFTEKIDGTNVRVIWDGQNIAYQGRTDRAVLPIDLLKALQGIFELQRDAFVNLLSDKTLVLYGEGYGGKIQKGLKYRETPGFILFDVRIGHWWLKHEDVISVADAFGLEAVPYRGSGTLWDAVEAARDGIPSLFGNFEAEGYVARPKAGLLDRAGQRIIAKIKCRDFQ
jgi:hypothetical protein